MQNEMQQAIGKTIASTRPGELTFTDGTVIVLRGCCKVLTGQARLVALIGHLEPDDITLLQMWYLDGATYPDIAEALGRTVNAVRVRHYWLKEQLGLLRPDRN